jgi:hypothetical protein
VSTQVFSTKQSSKGQSVADFVSSRNNTTPERATNLDDCGKVLHEVSCVNIMTEANFQQ